MKPKNFTIYKGNLTSNIINRLILTGNYFFVIFYVIILLMLQAKQIYLLIKHYGNIAMTTAVHSTSHPPPVLANRLVGKTWHGTSAEAITFVQLFTF